MIKTLTRTGNSTALIIDKEIQKATGLQPGSEVEVSTNGDVIIVSPVRSAERTKRLRAVMRELDDEYAGAFKRLAE